MRILTLLACTSLLGACATSFSTLDQVLPKLVGRNISVAISYLGIPNNEYNIAGNRVFVWSTSETFTTSQQVATTTSGIVGTTPIQTLSTSYVPTTSNLNCVIKTMMDGEFIRRVEYEGNNGVCMKYANRLKPLVSQ